MKRLCPALLAALLGSGCSPANIEYVKQCAPETWKSVGFKIVGYEGYQWGFWGLNGYGGAKVWYALRAEPDNGIKYTGSIQRWGDECHVYGPTAIDAIKPDNL